MKNKKTEKIFAKIGISIACITLILLTIALIHHFTNKYPIERAVKKWDGLSKNDELCRLSIIEEDKAMAYIVVGCKPVTHKCSSEYYIFLNKINDKWVVDESSKIIVWEK